MLYTFWSTLVRTINMALLGNCWCHSCRDTSEFFISFHYQALYPAHHWQEVKAVLHGWKRQIEILTTENCKHNALPYKGAQTRSFTLSTARLAWCFTEVNLIKWKRDDSWYHNIAQCRHILKDKFRSAESEKWGLKWIFFFLP